MIKRLTGLGLFLVLASAIANAEPIVEVAQGELRGHAEDGIESFLGIPFAAPPVDELRWQPPKPPQEWDDVRAARELAPKCPQADHPGIDEFEGGGQEDCLYLNLWRPADSAGELPVMVWLHGGAHRFGSASQPRFRGHRLAGRDVVVVTINYRLGALGFFEHPAINPDRTGNFGLLDQIKALEWVKENVSTFGGDPDRITLFGQSAGAMDILYLMTLAPAEGLFNQAIVQSAGGWAEPDSKQERSELMREALDYLGVEDDDAGALKDIPAHDWVEALEAVQEGLGFGPYIDESLVTQAPSAAFASGEVKEIPLLIGANSWDGSLARQAELRPRQRALARLPRLVQAYSDEARDRKHRLELIFGDIAFAAPARWIARQHADLAPVYLYHFDYLAEALRSKRPGVAHGGEISYVFDYLDGSSRLRHAATESDRHLASLVADCWAAFARGGQPECSLGDWTPYSREQNATFVIGAESGERADFRSDILDLITRRFGP